MSRLAAVVFVLAAVPGSAEPQIGAGVHFDFVVSDERGRPVADLRSGEVRIVDDQGVLLFSELQFVEPVGRDRPVIASAADRRIPAATDPPDASAARVVALFLDEYHVRPADSPRVRDGLRRFIEQYVGPMDRLIVLKPLESLLTLRTTTGPREALQALSTFEGRKGDYVPRNEFERNYIAADAGRAEAVRAQIALSALQALVTHVGQQTHGRKAVIIVSEGFQPPPGRRGSGLPSIDALVRTSNQAKVSFYPVDPHAFRDDADVAPTGSAPTIDGSNDAQRLLRRLASETDGVLTVGPSMLASGWDRLVAELGGYYIVTFPSALDGRFHPLLVSVTRPGTRVRARRGYWARAPDAQATGRVMERLRRSGSTTESATTAVLPALRSSRLIKPWFGLSRGDDRRTRITFAWEPTARALGERPRPPAIARVSLTAFAADGTELFQSAVRPTGTAHSADPPSVIFEVTPGRVRVRLTIEDAAARVLDTDVRDVAVPTLRDALALGTPSVIRTRTARDRRVAITDLSAPPTVSREFSRFEHVLIRCPVYADGAVTVTATLVGRSGRALRPLPATRRPETDLYEVDLSLAPFAIGEYAVQLAASSEAGTVRDVVPVRVVP